MIYKVKQQHIRYYSLLFKLSRTPNKKMKVDQILRIEFEYCFPNKRKSNYTILHVI